MQHCKVKGTSLSKALFVFPPLGAGVDAILHCHLQSKHGTVFCARVQNLSQFQIQFLLPQHYCPLQSMAEIGIVSFKGHFSVSISTEDKLEHSFKQYLP